MLSDDFRRTMAIGEAKRIWRLYGFQVPRDLVLEDLGLALGVIVLEAPLDSADARLIRKGGRGLIRVNRGIPQPGRKRFAVAHEIGHWRMHAAVSQVLACTSEDMRKASYKGSDPEVEANWFASELLMPEALFAPRMKSLPPSVELIDALAEEFGTTRTATAVRFVEISDSYCAMAVSENGKVKWWRASSELRSLLWIKSGLVLSRRTLAGRIHAGEDVQSTTQRVGMNEWADRYPEFAEEAVESTIPLGQTGAVLTTLWID